MMSTKSENRKRAQKHQNKTAWKIDKFHTDPKTKIVQSIVVNNCCEKCTGIIQWKINYGKYKPLSQPGKCTRCSEKRIKSAYHTICSPCVGELKVCAKCGAREEVVNHSFNSAEETKLRLDIDKEVKRISERKRRAFLRDLEKKESVAGKSKPLPEDATPEEKPEVYPSILEVRKAAFEILQKLVEEAKAKDFDFADDPDDFELNSEEDDEDDTDN